MIRASGALTSSQGRDYYDKEYSKGDYYTEDGRSFSGQWSGRGAEMLGLRGHVEREVFEAVLEGKAGLTGEQLIPGEVGTGKHRAGWDFTCSPEKSVSIMALVGGDAGIAEDVRASNRKAMVELERFALAKDKARNLEATGNLVIASFEHETSRRLDPQLHIHNVVMNMTRRSDGKFVGLETREMFAAQAFVKAVFHADLARRLQARGYDIEVRKGGVVAIRDVPQALVEEFSKRRRKDIEPYLAARGQSGAKAAENAAIRTRRVKDHEVDREALKAFWAATARDQGVDLQSIRNRGGERQAPGTEARRERAREALGHAIEHVSERRAAFAGREVLGPALRQGMGVITLEDVREAVKADRVLIRVEAPDSPSHRYTTEQALHLERSNVRAIRQGMGAGRAILEGQRFEPSRPLSDGQRRVAEHILLSRDQVLAVEGKAGAGKTYTLQAVVEAASSRGWAMQGFAPDTSAVKTLSTETGIPARTLAAMAREMPAPATGPQLWLVDEAGKMSSRQAADLFAKAQAAGAKVVLVGDRLQHAAVEAGMPFAYLQGAGLRAERLDEIRRQKDLALLAAVVDASEGRTREAVAKLVAQGRVAEHGKQGERHQAVVRDYLATPRGQTCLVIAPSNEERRDLNHRIREALIEAGRIRKDSFEASVRISRGLTQAQKREVRSYEAGDLLTFHRGSRVFGILQGAAGRVVGVDQDRRTVQVELEGGRQVAFAPARFRGAEVHQVEPRRFAMGDRIQYREASKPEGGRIQGQGFRIANGEVGIIRDLDRRTGHARVELEGSRRSVLLDLGRVQPVDHAYAITSHASQGRTVDRALVVVDGLQGRELVNRQQFYVSLSRARLDARIYTTSREELAAAVSRDAGKGSALELVKGRSMTRMREVKDEQADRSHAEGLARAGGAPAGTRERVRPALGLARKPGRVFGGGAPGRPGGIPEPPQPAAQRRGPADRAAERNHVPAEPDGGPDGYLRRILGRMGGAGAGRALGLEPGAGGPGRGPAAAGGGPPGPPAGPGGREGRGYDPSGIRAPEPGLGRPGPEERDGGRGPDEYAVPGPGGGGAGGLGVEAPGGRGGRGEGTGGPSSAAAGGHAALGVDRGDAGGAGGRGSHGPGAEMNPGEAGRLRVPRALEALEPDLQRLWGRIRACGLEDPFREDRLRNLPPRAVRTAVEEARKAGVMDEGPGWPRERVADLATGLERAFRRELDLELPGGRGF